MIGLLIVFGILFFIGLFLLLADILKLPTIKTAKAMMNNGKSRKRLEKSIHAVLMDMAVWMSGYIKIEEYKRGRMRNILNASGMQMSPEVYMAYAYLKTAGVLLLLIPSSMLMPLLSVLVIFFSIMVYFKEIGRADEQLKEKREKIEGELCRFVNTVEQELKSSRDVLSMLEHYKNSAGVDFRVELDILCADMRSSSYETALTRFAARLNSPQMSDIVRGLIGVLRGDDGAVYFQMLSHDFRQMELRRLKEKAGKIPPKIRVYSFFMLMCFLATYFAIIGYEIIRSMSSMF